MYMSRLRSLCLVMKGRAVAPPGIAFIIGVSTSRKPCMSRKRRRKLMARVRVMNVLRVVGFLIHDDSYILIIIHHQHVTIALRVVCCVHDQVEVALAVASFLVGEAARAGRDLGQHVQARGQQQHVRREEGELAALRLARSAADADNVAALESRHQRREAGRLLVLFEPGVVAELVGGGEDLHLSSVADHVEEDESFSARALGGDPAGEADAAVRRHLS
mmetsp:Transcript_34754/g.111025  ORF Transcript_34754/g.111025 Transcript_34754/m.111025 type:complete len:219 (-) Transcript_34754:404-1060(-)